MDENLIPVLIIAIIMIAVVMKARYKHLENRADLRSPDQRADTMRLEEELKALRQRVQTLERIAVEKENSLAREIEDLRGR